jgi:mannosyltransferase
MEPVRRARGASTRKIQLPSLDNDKSSRTTSKTLKSKLDFFKKPLKLRGNSSVSVPMGVMIVFPVLVLVLILALFVMHPGASSQSLMPAGAPPAIRSVQKREKLSKRTETHTS